MFTRSSGSFANHTINKACIQQKLTLFYYNSTCAQGGQAQMFTCAATLGVQGQLLIYMKYTK